MPRQTYTTLYKQLVLAEYDRLPHGEKGVFLEREGLRSSTVSQWRAQRDEAGLSGLSRGPGRPPSSETDRENAALRREIEVLKARVAELEEVIERQGKLSALLDALAVSGVTGTGRRETS